MERLSIFDIFKIGVGPSSSHTLGPWIAGRRFVSKVKASDIVRIQIQLFGSLSKTGRGHGTDIAILMGLLNYDPRTINTDLIFNIIEKIKEEHTLCINGRPINFSWEADIILEDHSLAYHPNAMTLLATHDNGRTTQATYYSVGGGFIEEENHEDANEKAIVLPFPIDSGIELEGYITRAHPHIYDIVCENELSMRSETALKAEITEIYNTMIACVYKGCHTEGTLPGGLKVIRRAKKMADNLMESRKYDDVASWLQEIGQHTKEFSKVNRWVNCFALAVNEENAAFGRIVTSPTNGAAGVIPAVLLYHVCFGDFKGDKDIINFFLTAGEVGCIFKKRATISAAVGGCQAEIGVSSAMAAAGLTEIMGGTPAQALMAAEIAMEHHLGLTCDPIGGLVQIPCIERNAMGAMKAITASNLALDGNPDDAIVKFDMVVKTMWDTAQDMHHKYKETAEGGLAINLSVIQPSC